MTLEEINELSLEELKNTCNNLGITGYSRMSRMKLIKTLDDHFKATRAKDHVFSDRNYIPVGKGDIIKARVSGTNWVSGVVQKMRLVDDADEYFWVLIDGQDKAIMYHANDIDASEYIPAPKKEEKQPEPASKIEDKSQPKEFTLGGASEQEIQEYLNESGFRSTKYDHILAKYNRMGVNKGTLVEFTVSKTSKVNPGKVIREEVKSFSWDKQGSIPYFVINHEGKDYFKTIQSVRIIYHD